MSIAPTVGRVVLFYPPANVTRAGGKPLRASKGQPFPALITHVWGASCVNVAPLPDGTFGELPPYTSVLIREPLGDGESGPDGAFCTWMPYQVGQAARTEQAEAELARSRPTT